MPADAQAIADGKDEPGKLTVVGIGASAGGLDACRRLVASMPGPTGMAFILVQHLDPTHESLLVNLLAGHTHLTVCEAVEGTPIAAEHLYVIPPGVYLAVKDGVLHLSQPTARHGARLPFDHLLVSLAEEYGDRAACVVLTGNGTDGSLGIGAIKARHGLVVTQDPDEAAYDGMPRSALLTGLVDLVLPIARIPHALLQHAQHATMGPSRPDAPRSRIQERIGDIIALLRKHTKNDFTHYKHGTLGRRIERRMAIALEGGGDIDVYYDLLGRDAQEMEKLAKDLLIHVTRFFRDPSVFDLLADKTIPAIIRRQPAETPLRLWIAGCSTGEEAYSLAMLFLECAAADDRGVTVQIFASDIDAESILTAREGLYPASITADVSPDRLKRWFRPEGDSFRVLPELRSSIVFTVQDMLKDPPFSRIDFISCRNVLIYLRPAAQAQAIGLFHFALRQGGTLLLGNAETIAGNDDRFEEESKLERIFRRVGASRPGEVRFSLAEGPLGTAMQGAASIRSRQPTMGEFVQRLVMDGHAPATVLLNRQHECLYSIGPIDRFLRVAPGDPSRDVLTMARHNMQGRLRSGILRALSEDGPIVIAGGRTTGGDASTEFNISLTAVTHDGVKLVLVSFLELPTHPAREALPVSAAEQGRVLELEHELVTTRSELQDAIRSLNQSEEEQKSIHEESLSVNEEFQSTNEELLTSKEELQSLNEELTALNTQLHETLDRKRATANDLLNVLNSTDVATIFLDADFHIRLFTPATKALFNIIPGDVGRPLKDLSSLAFDADLLADVRTVLRQHEPVEREIETHTGRWFVRRILPYRTSDDIVEGVVITFVDATERRHIADMLQRAKRQAEMANVAKSRFVAAASHDLRQPLQTLALLQGLLAAAAEGPKAKTLISRLGDTLGAMSGMLNTLLDLNQIEAGTLLPEVSDFVVNDLLSILRDEFAYLAQARGLELRVVPCTLLVRTDPRMLEQMMRNLISNAVKYTQTGKVLVGCRRAGDKLLVEVLDTGIGIPAEELGVIFDDYHQVDNNARERSRGLGLGLSIVQQLGSLLGHKVDVRSQLGHGSVFSIEVQRPPAAVTIARAPVTTESKDAPLPPSKVGRGIVLVVEDDPDLRDLLVTLIDEEGHQVVAAADGMAALELVRKNGTVPDLLLTDFNLPLGIDGLQLAAQLRAALHRPIPVIVLTGDTSTATLRAVAAQDCVHMHKPAKVAHLNQTIRDLLLTSASALPEPAAADVAPVHDDAISGRVIVVDDDRLVRDAMRTLLQDNGMVVEDYASAETFLAAYHPRGNECLLLDIYLPNMSGLQLVSHLRKAGYGLPVVMITGKGDVAVAVQAMKAGAMDFVEKPVSSGQLLSSLKRALTVAHDASELLAWRETAVQQVATLTPRQREIMDLVLAGHPSKNIAADLGISQRTVENHRASIMHRTKTRSLPALARLALAASGKDAATPPVAGPARQRPGRP